MWWARFGRGFGTDVRQTTKWMNGEWDDDIEMDGEAKNKYKTPFLTKI
jgi:hypothetical protein